MIETTIRLKDRKYWRPGHRPPKSLITARWTQAVKFPGLANSWGYPIKIRIDMLSTGIKTPVGLKILGPDLEVLNRLGTQAEAIFKEVPGTASAFAERVTGGYYLDFDIKRREAARYGLTVGDVQDVITTALGGKNITQTVEGLERYPVNLRYFQDYRENLPALRRVLIPTPTGPRSPWTRWRTSRSTRAPPMINSEGSRRGRLDLRGHPRHRRGHLHQEGPGGHRRQPEAAGGLYLHLERPVRIHGAGPEAPGGHHPHHPGHHLLHPLHQHPLPHQGVIVILAVPFSLVGAIWLLYLLGYNISVAVVVGLIALAGLDAETGVVMLLYLDIAYHRAQQEGRLITYRDTEDAVIERRGAAAAPQAHDRAGHPAGPAAPHVGHRHRLRRP